MTTDLLLDRNEGGSKGLSSGKEEEAFGAVFLARGNNAIGRTMVMISCIFNNFQVNLFHTLLQSIDGNGREW